MDAWARLKKIVWSSHKHPSSVQSNCVSSAPLWLPGIIQRCSWLVGVQFVKFMTFNVESEFLSLFVHGYKTAEPRNSLVVANLALRQQPWVAIFLQSSAKSLGQKGIKGTRRQNGQSDGMSPGSALH